MHKVEVGMKSMTLGHDVLMNLSEGTMYDNVA